MAYAKDLKLAAHTLEVLIDPMSRRLEAHLPSLEKALNNLIDNAVKYSAEGTVISLKAYADGDNYFISVSDQGPGIASRYQNHIFEKFCRIPEQNRHTVKGLGLGLYISRAAIEQSGGSLNLTSSQGQGCTFTIKFPLHEG
jgi:two-component system phosphate regulon sensor histidine kinase PhoR